MVPVMYRTIMVNGVTPPRAVSKCHHMGHNTHAYGCSSGLHITRNIEVHQLCLSDYNPSQREGLQGVIQEEDEDEEEEEEEQEEEEQEVEDHQGNTKHKR